MVVRRLRAVAWRWGCWDSTLFHPSLRPRVVSSQPTISRRYIPADGFGVIHPSLRRVFHPGAVLGAFVGWDAAQRFCRLGWSAAESQRGVMVTWRSRGLRAVGWRWRCWDFTLFHPSLRFHVVVSSQPTSLRFFIPADGCVVVGMLGFHVVPSQPTSLRCLMLGYDCTLLHQLITRKTLI